MTRRTLIFDIGGVVVRWQPAALLREALPHHARDDASAAAMVAAVFQGLGPDADWALFDRGQIEPGALEIAREQQLRVRDNHPAMYWAFS